MKPAPWVAALTLAGAAVDLRRLDRNGQRTSATLFRTSSATAEDTAEYSFAGIHESYLNVRGAEALLHRVRSCWASAYAPRAIDAAFRVYMLDRKSVV